MAGEVYAVGKDIWIPCEVQPGSSPDELQRVYLQVGDAEWFGFVNTADIRNENGRAFVRATVIGVGSKGYIVQLRGTSMGSEAIQAPQEVFQRHGAIAA
jgi:hypothetical protein